MTYFSIILLLHRCYKEIKAGLRMSHPLRLNILKFHLFKNLCWLHCYDTFDECNFLYNMWKYPSNRAQLFCAWVIVLCRQAMFFIPFTCTDWYHFSSCSCQLVMTNLWPIFHSVSNFWHREKNTQVNLKMLSLVWDMVKRMGHGKTFRG